MSRNMAKHQVAAPTPSPCPECGAQRISGEALHTVSVTRVNAAIPGITAPLSYCWALICPQCGHTTLYAKDPAKLREL